MARIAYMDHGLLQMYEKQQEGRIGERGRWRGRGGGEGERGREREREERRRGRERG